MASRSKRERVPAHFFDLTTGQSFSFFLPDPPPHEVDFPYWIDERFVPVKFNLLYVETEAIDRVPHFIYISEERKQPNA